MTDAGCTCGGTVDGGRSAVLVVRVWTEDGARTLRGRLTARDTSPGGAGAPGTTVALAASADEVVDAVRAWLDALGRDPPRAADGELPAAAGRRRLTER